MKTLNQILSFKARTILPVVRARLVEKDLVMYLFFKLITMIRLAKMYLYHQYNYLTKLYSAIEKMFSCSANII